MQSPRSSSSTILLILVLVLTAPFWLTIGGIFIGVFGGLLGGLFGAVFGIIGGLLGAFFGLITLPFKLVFGSCDFDGGSFLSENILFTVALLILVVALFRRRS